MNSQYIIIGAGIIIALIISAIVLIAAAWRAGRRNGFIARKTRYGEELQQLRTDLQTAKAEQEQLRHTLRKSEQQTQRLRTDIERTRDTAAQALEQQQQRHGDELAAAQAGTPAITESDLKNVQRMVDKLNHLSLDLRNKNRFRDSKEAANRAATGQRLIDRLFEERFKSLNTPDATSTLTATADVAADRFEAPVANWGQKP
ncbi:hypothetical protein EF096_15795 [Pseudomonas neustonica]|uniref:DNA recombination protein RmuC n=1 Tax=Pseudomonas neustonica TaxID=2487346 RepID=A0ABX9XGP8_9PSED|nr:MULTISPECIES: hypothetical protein [Pseudomonas]ROZ80924.1 hypothetical protein EF099_16260 [Pseudomonas sp. SSM44]ROZ82122.1 hypothetical protein EF096_15795 [Pseudomonas neustonica]